MQARRRDRIPFDRPVRAENFSLSIAECISDAPLERAGAVLVAKLALGAFATGDCWFGGQTMNPWDPCQGSSGSSSGSAAAAAAGLVGFALGCETHGSIISPCRTCGASGLRPTFGRVSRHVSFIGRLFEESTLLAVAHSFQQAAGDHLRRPPIERHLAAKAVK
jgi:Asp-tRNA(Asn)/Glu-tRNA(Gln) amidotransferase A subunit family amidase